MADRDILVVFDNPEGVAQRLAPAAALARAMSARITGLFATGYPLATSYGDMSGWVQLVDAFLAAQRAQGNATEAAFRQELARLNLAGDWLYRETDATESAIALAALFDLVVLGQANPDADPGVRPEAVMLGSGRPVLVVPYAGNFAEIGRRVVVAWNATREATRALHDALPLLEMAEAVTVIEVDPVEPMGGIVRTSAADIATALGRRGIKASAQTETAGDDIGIDDLLLSRAADLAADLVVMGAYGHSRLREFVLGGVSRGILRHMTVPVLMAH